MPQMLAQLPPMIATMQNTRTMLTMHSTMGGLVATQEDANNNPMAMGNAFDESKNEDSFFMSQDIIDNNQAFQQIKEDFHVAGWEGRTLPSSRRMSILRPRQVFRV